MTEDRMGSEARATEAEEYDARAEELPAVDGSREAGADGHPEGPTEAEAAAGEELYRLVDDLDDDSNGLGE